MLLSVAVSGVNANSNLTGAIIKVAQKTITGKVTDEKGLPLPGVVVKIKKDPSNAVTTNAQGNYQLISPDDNAKIIFSFVGYETQEQSAKGKTVINVVMVPMQTALEEVVVGGYSSQQRRSLTDAIRTINSVEAKRNSVTNLTNAIVARTPGVRVVKADPGLYHTDIDIRGFSGAAGGSAGQGTKNLPADIITINGYGNQVAKTGLREVRATPGNESYLRIIENQFLDPKVTPLSTFAVDVDAASYSNIRRFINGGQLPPKNAVRIEEMVNYFHYNLPEPANGKPVAIQTELSAAPWNPQHQLVRIGLKAKNVNLDKLPPSNLVFLLDVSGSMAEPNKLSLVKPAMKMLVDQLRPIDHVAIVVYAGDAGIRLESTPGNEKEKIKEAIDQLNASGSTAGGEGIKLAYRIAKERFIKGGNNRIILATDGDFNVGPSSDKDMEQLIEDERGSGVSISILGFGMGNLKDSKMERMADKGHGNYAYIDNITEATKSMVSEFGGTLFTVAKDVKLQVEFNPAKVQAYRLLGYEDRLSQKEDFNNDTKVAGDMGVNHTVTALYELIPVGVKDNFTASVDPLKYQKPAEDKITNTSSEIMTIKFRYKEPDSDVSKLEAVTVDDKPLNADKTSDDFRFAAAVAEYGMLLRDSQFKQNSKFDQLINMAKSAKGKDDDGYRAEFIRLAESTKNMMKSSELAVRNE